MTDKKNECWIFTFGSGHKHQGFFVRIYGTYHQARDLMIEKYGTAWAFQYSQEEWDEWVMANANSRYMPTEKELEVLRCN